MDISEFSFSNDECFSYLEEPTPTYALSSMSTIKFDDFDVQTFMYSKDNLSYLTNYIYPFWRQQFISNLIKDAEDKDTFNPYSTWSNTDLARHNMGLKDNTFCFQLVVCDVPIGFASLLLLDQFDRTDRMSPFSDEIYTDSLLFYNFVIEKGFRGEGYGGKLLDIVIQYIKMKLSEYKYMILYVDKDNTVAKKIYEKKGFKSIGDNPMNTNQDLYKLCL
jgi:ribosomal protein S18 acetylase RimI-like enzyme